MTPNPTKAIAQSNRLDASKTLELVKIILLLSFITWIVRFWHISDFGLYEDDYTRIPKAVVMPFSQLCGFLVDTLIHFKGQGRPFHPGFIYLFSWLGWQIGELRSIYWIGYIIVSLNAVLFYLFLRRISSQIFAITGALLLCLYPADTTQIFITHSLGVQPSLTFFLLASLLYLSDRRFSAYTLIACSLLTYETIYPVFLAIPLLRLEWDSKIKREIINHALTLGMLLLIVVILRTIVSETRIMEMSFGESALFSVRQAFLGPLVNLSLYLFRPLQVIFSMNAGVALGIVISSLTIGWGLLQIKLSTDVQEIHPIFSDKNTLYQFVRSEKIQEFYKLAFVGLVMLVLAYPLMLTVPGFRISGRATRVHFAGIVGASLIGASVSSVFLLFGTTYGRKRLSLAILTIFYSFLAGFGFLVQRDYQVSWTLQQEYWTEIVQLVTDAGSGIVILVDPAGLKDVKQIGANTWNLPRILDQIYIFPVDWIPDSPRVYRLKPNWQENIGVDPFTFQINKDTVDGPPSLFRTVASADVILLEFKNGRYVRRISSLVIDDDIYILKPVGDPILPSLEPGTIYDLLIQGTPK